MPNVVDFLGLSPSIVCWADFRLSSRLMMCASIQSLQEQEENFYDFNFLPFLVHFSSDCNALHLNWKELKNENTKKKNNQQSDTPSRPWPIFFYFALPSFVCSAHSIQPSFDLFCQIWYPRCSRNAKCNVNSNLHVIHLKRFEMEQRKKTITRISTDIWVLFGSRDVFLSRFWSDSVQKCMQLCINNEITLTVIFIFALLHFHNSSQFEWWWNLYK